MQVKGLINKSENRDWELESIVARLESKEDCLLLILFAMKLMNIKNILQLMTIKNIIHGNDIAI